uniref:Uncharacterized protein n=1 Tax=Cynoglossus semilaevis TaxID=244447 RepID=A0A3P8VG33_CYNSE
MIYKLRISGQSVCQNVPATYVPSPFSIPFIQLFLPLAWPRSSQKRRLTNI